MSLYQVDLTNCDREPIHIPGKVQSHGFLVAVDAKTYNITYISQNIAAFL
jgi:chemotaxis family two-component system sensor kinase Cph1